MELQVAIRIIKIVVFIIVILISCRKEESLPCYECLTTSISTTNPYLPGYPDTTKSVHDLCNQTEEQIKSYEYRSAGSLSTTIPSMTIPGGVQLTKIYSTKCTIR